MNARPEFVVLSRWCWLVGRLANDAAIERDAFKLDCESAILVALCDTDPVPEALAVSCFTDVIGDMSGLLAVACCWGCFFGHKTFLSGCL